MRDTASARLTRASGTSFYYAFRLLPAEKRRAIYALYSFCRVVDDCVDEQGGEGEAGPRALAGGGATAATRAAATPSWARAGGGAAPASRSRARCFEDIVAGCRMDLTSRATRPSPTCASTASAWPPRWAWPPSRSSATANPARARLRGRSSGVALQLTNILRDVGADAARGPALPAPRGPRAASGVRGASSCGRAPAARAPAAAAPLLRFQARARAREHYAPRGALLPAEDRRVDARRRDHGGRLPRAARRARARAGYPLSAAARARSRGRARPGSPCARSSARARRDEGGGRRRRLRRPRRRHRAPGAAARGHAARAARRARRAGHLVTATRSPARTSTTARTS